LLPLLLLLLQLLCTWLLLSCILVTWLLLSCILVEYGHPWPLQSSRCATSV
jgi:hypothetical protein